MEWVVWCDTAAIACVSVVVDAVAAAAAATDDDDAANKYKNTGNHHTYSFLRKMIVLEIRVFRAPLNAYLSFSAYSLRRNRIWWCFLFQLCCGRRYVLDVYHLHVALARDTLHVWPTILSPSLVCFFAPFSLPLNCNSANYRLNFEWSNRIECYHMYIFFRQRERCQIH